MTRTRKWSPLAVLGAVAIVFTACGGAASPNPSTPRRNERRQRGRPSQAASQAAYDGMVYPETGEAPCGSAPYTGQLKKITADRRAHGRVPAVQPGRRLPAEDRLQRVRHPGLATISTRTRPDGSLLDKPNGTGPYKLKEWSQGQPDGLRGVRRLLGHQGPDPEPRVPAGATRPPQRLLELQAGTVDGIDNPGTDDITAIQGDTDVTVLGPRAGLNVSFLGMNNTVKPCDDEKVRQAIAMGIDRKQIVDNFYPEGSTAADYFTPCEIPFALRRRQARGTSIRQAPRRSSPRPGFPNGFDTKIQFRAAVRGYVPDPPLIATEIAQQLKANLNINAEPELLESAAMLDGFAAGTLDGLVMVGWGADYPDPSNFLDYHFGSGSGKKFGTPFPDIVDGPQQGRRDR